MSVTSDWESSRITRRFYRKLLTISNTTAKYNVLGLQLDEWACGHFRCRDPINTLRELGHHTYVVRSGRDNFDVSSLKVAPYTHIIAQRQVNPLVLGYMLKCREAYGTKLLWEADDNLHRVHPTSHAYEVFKPGGDVLKSIDQFIRHVDGLIVTTKDLAGQYSHLHNRIYVLPNFVDFHVRDWETPVPRDPRLEGKIVVGWAGGSTHQEDDEPLRGVLNRILRDYADVVCALCSHPKIVEMFISRMELPVTKVVALDPVSFQEYPKIPAQFDIGLAPLRNTTFNRAKSDLKLKEYGARGVPYVATDIANYRRFHQETYGVGGYIAANPAQWDEAIRMLIETPVLLEAKAKGIKATVKNNHSLRGNIQAWEAVLTDVLTPNKVNTWESVEKPGRNSPCPCGALDSQGKPIKYKRHCSPAFG